MSANNAIYVLQVKWTYPSERTFTGAIKEKTEDYFFVFEGDVDMWGELTRAGKLKKSAMWKLMLEHNLRRFEKRDTAYTYAHDLNSERHTEYGLLALSVAYHSSMERLRHSR
jgi:hypothetical protein